MDDLDDHDRLLKRCTDREGRIDKRMLHARGVLSDNNLFGVDDVNPDPLGGVPLVEAKGFSASGVIADQPYWAAILWGGELGDAVAIRGRDAEWLTGLLEQHEGSAFQILQPSAGYPLTLDHPLSILAALMNLSTNFDWSGDKPPGYPRQPRYFPGVDH